MSWILPLRPKDFIESIESKKVSGLFYYTNTLLKSLNTNHKSTLPTLIT
ncbi:hypothetical protein DCO58_01170 [Helicobacter saguini]|uniref:Uncharacterized protein n=1 Tax=Helicobacter saguini TaxID=1548018 RepID=A0A6B0HLD8_9HELI|nr:hypothetical protein [Helicobacter saguini]MWV63000.1 hypothetical protein [Helicobacter saguini]MWV66331.1 hypothetical protein [Helicobacter saguini]MWV68683.1 hypothetical protein [Helicobacter saguini]MWV71766.1 hypothetical protein [Helicobacter saguini]